MYGCKKINRKIGVLLAQLGTPEAPTAKALRPYLKKFLGDPRVIEKPRWLWWLILNFIILNVRPKRSAKLYSRIWTKNGSPLEVITKSQTQKLKERFLDNDQIEITYGMRYSKPSIETALDELINKGCSSIVLLNMYPQYSGTTVAANYDAVFKHLLTKRVVPTLKVIDPYYDNSGYINALAEIANKDLELNHPEKLVLSYHGIPESYIDSGDTYCCQCMVTTKMLLPKLKIAPENVIHTYQSRFGKDPWLEPYTDLTIEKLAKEGVKHISVFCPGFTADCLETLDELGNEGKHLFNEHGGEKFNLISCLNDHQSWIDAMASMVYSEINPLLTNCRLDCEFLCPNKQAQIKK